MNSEPSQAKMRQLGMVLKGYRDAAGLSQDNLAERLKTDAGYSGPQDRSQISNYERGRFLPNKDFLIAFLTVVEPLIAEKGTMLDDQDAHLLLKIAGYASDSEPEVSDLRPSVDAMRDGLARLDARVFDLSQKVSSSVVVADRAKDALIKFAPPALFVAAAAFIIDQLDLVRTWVILAYLVIGISIGAGTIVSRRFRTHAQDRIGDLFFISVFFVLSTPLLQGAFTRMDHYGFHTLPSYTGSAVPFMLAMLVNLVLAIVATIIFNVLRQRLQSGGNSLSPLMRAVWSTLLPVAFLYTNVLVFCNPGIWTNLLSTLGTLGGAFIALVVFHDPSFRMDEGDRWMVKGAFAVVLLLSTCMAVWTLVAHFAEPNMVSSGDHNTIWASDTEAGPLDSPTPEYFEQLGYPADEYGDRDRFGLLWMSIATNMYVTLVFGVSIVSAIRNRLRETTSLAEFPRAGSYSIT